MEKLRLCIGSNDGENVAKTHMGDTIVFYVYDLKDNGESEFIEKRTNVAREMEHDTKQKMQHILKIVMDCDVLVAGQKSPNFVNIANKTKYQPVVVNGEKIKDIFILLSSSYKEICTLVQRRQNGESFDTIPVV